MKSIPEDSLVDPVGFSNCEEPIAHCDILNEGNELHFAERNNVKKKEEEKVQSKTVYCFSKKEDKRAVGRLELTEVYIS